MPRSRNIKPGLLENDCLGECDDSIRLLFHCLPMFADKEGVIEYRPKRMLKDMWGYRKDVSVEDLNRYITVISRLDNHSMLDIIKYEGKIYLLIKGFSKHQNPHHTEKKGACPLRDSLSRDGTTVASPLCHGEDPADSGFRIPDSVIPDTVAEKSAIEIIEKKSFDLITSKRLAEFLELKQKRTIGEEKIKLWSKDIKSLIEKDISNRPNIKGDVTKVLQTIINESGASYFPEVQSGRSFREKFLQIEAFNNRKNNNNGSNVKGARPSVSNQHNEIIREIESGKYLSSQI